MNAINLNMHWQALEPYIKTPTNEQEYDALVTRLDAVLDIARDEENHPLNSLAAAMGDLIEAYDEVHYPMPEVHGVEILRYLMNEHNLMQRDLPEVGVQSVVSQVLNGKREINKRQALALAKRFNIDVSVFL